MGQCALNHRRHLDGTKEDDDRRLAMANAVATVDPLVQRYAVPLVV
jgi:hypothetical protein